LAQLSTVITGVWGFVAVWIGAVTATELKGWKQLLLPLAVLSVIIGSLLISVVFLSSVSFTFKSVFGWL
jgi:hypothetical protein